MSPSERISPSRLVFDSNTSKILSSSPSKTILNRDASKASFAGTSSQSIERAQRLHENPVGPGTYEMRYTIGKKENLSHKKNAISYSIGLPYMVAVNPENRNSHFAGKNTPPSTIYNIPTDNINFNRHKQAIMNEKKFFQIQNMNRIKAQVPIQYSTLDCNTDVYLNSILKDPRTLRNQQYHISSGGKVDQYKQATFGFGERSDFRKNGSVKADFDYDYENMNTLKSSIDDLKKRGTRLDNTFGNTFDKYSRAVISGAAHFSKVNETSHHQMLGLQEMTKGLNLTKHTSPRLPNLSANRGLLSTSLRQNEKANVGPGAYNLNLSSFKKNLQTPKGTFAQAKRDTHFSRYAELNKANYSKIHQ